MNSMSACQSTDPAVKVTISTELERHRNTLAVFISRVVESNERLEKTIIRAVGPAPAAGPSPAGQGKVEKATPPMSGLVGELSDQANVLSELLDTQLSLIGQLECIV